jgi:membrane protease YdiL (CAAX protease family)/tetratricopeptide (TPR) repeat protein
VLGLFVVRSIAVPALFLGLFSFFKRLRTARARVMTLLCFWSLTALLNVAGAMREQVIARNRPQKIDVGAFLAQRHWAKPSATNTLMEPAPAPAPSPTLIRPVRTASGPWGTIEFSPGSDERLIQEIGKAQEKRYHEVVEAYRQVCDANPDDDRLALEWVRFTQRFAYSEDVAIESAEDDYEAAKARLLERFPEAPGTVLFELGQLHGEVFETRAQARMGRLKTWPPKEIADFMLLRARHAQRDGPSRAGDFAKTSFQNFPSAEAALVWARGLIHTGNGEEAAVVLRHAVFATATPWQRKQQIDLFFDAGAGTDAVALLPQLKADHPAMMNDFELVSRLTQAGRVDLARSVLEAIPVQDWNRGEAAQHRFDFEMAHGDAAAAAQAYREWRSSDPDGDGFARHRLALALKHPGLAWTSNDMLGLICLGLLLGSLALSPLLVLIPVHYISLLRTLRGKYTHWTLTPWGLRPVWFVMALAFVLEVAFVWWRQPQEVSSWFSAREPRNATTVSGEELLTSQALLWIAMAAVTLGLLWRGRQWRLLGSQRWSVPACVAAGAGMALGLRMLLGIYLHFVPLDGLSVQPAALQITQLLRTMLERPGPWGFVVVIAGVVPLLEEVLFRGLALGALARHLPFGWANLIQAVGFACAHAVWELAPLFILFGLMTGWLTRRAGGLLPAIVLHATNNLIVAIGLMVLTSRT